MDGWGSFHHVMAKVMDCCFEVSEFKLQSLTDILGKVINLLFPLTPRQWVK